MKLGMCLSATLLGGVCLSSTVWAQDIVPQPEPLLMQAEANRMTVSGGEPGVACAILVGTDWGYSVLPGGAVIRLDALAVLTQGYFDEEGKYTWSFEPPREPIMPFDFFAQAVTIAEASGGTYRVSQLLSIEVDGAGNMRSHTVAHLRLERRAWESREERATRCTAVA